MEDKWNVKLYRIKLKRELLLNRLRRKWDIRCQSRIDAKLDHYLVNTRKERSGDDQGRCDLEEELYKNDGRYDC